MATFSVTDTVRRAQATGNGSLTTFSFSFQVNATSDIKVYVDALLKSESTHYAIQDGSSNAGLSSTGTGVIVFTSENIPANNAIVTIISDVPLARTSVYTAGGSITAAALEGDFDTITMALADREERDSRTLRAGPTEPLSINMELPSATARANHTIAFDSAGSVTVGNPVTITGFTFNNGQITPSATNDPLELFGNGTGGVIASPHLTVDNLKLDGNTFSSINSNGDINIFPNGSGTVNMDADLMVYGNDVNGVASYVQISASATGGDDIRLQGSNPVVASYDTSNVSAQTPSMLGAFSLYGKDTSGNYIAYATLRGYAEDPFAGTNGKEGSLRIQINDDSSIREHKFTATGLDVYNNITLSGTVDGRNIDTDGTKLDGITANATTYSFSDTNGTVTVTPAQGNAATLIIGTAAGSGGLAMRGNAGGADSVALGTSSNAIGVNAITIGKSATTSTGTNSPTNGIAIGEQAHSYGGGTTALGRQASSIGDNSIALGSYASVPATYHSSVALGYQATVNAANQIMLGTSNKTVKIPGALTVDGNITASGTVDGRDIHTDGTKLDGIETSADVTDATNVDAAGALMKSGGAMTGAITTNSTFDTRDVATDGTKLDTIETDADVTDATNVNAAGAVMVTDASTSGMGFVIDEDNMVSNSATKIPTQQSVKAYVDLNVSSSVQYRGSYNAATNSPNLDSSPSGITIGDMYTTTVAGTFYSTGLEIGDVLIAEVDDPSSVNDWTIVQQNLDAASIKSLYESNADTNAFDDAEQTKLSGIEAGADVNIGQYFMISANSQGVANGEIITTHPNASGVTSEVIDFTGAGGLTVARAGNNLTFTSANTTYGFADENGTVTITPSTGSAATLVIGTAAGSGGLAFRGNAGGADSVALGTSSNAIGINAIAIGKSATTSYGTNSPTNGIAIGEQAHSYGANTVALGRQASAEGASGIALGPYANVPSSYYNSTALGFSSTVTASNQIMLGTSGTAVNVPGTFSATGNSTFGGTANFAGAVTVGNSFVGSNSSHLANITVNNNGYIGSANATTALQIPTSGGLNVNGTVTAQKASSGATATSGTVLTIEDDDNTELSILGGSSSVLAINFGHSGDNDDGNINYNTTSGSEQMAFRVNAADRLTINKDGNSTFAGTVTAAKSIVKTASNDTFTIETVNTGGALSAHTTLTNSDGNVYFKVGTEDALTLGLNGGVDLYYNNELKFNTHVSGARVTSNLNLYSTDATASNGPDLILTRNSATPAASDDLGNIQFFGESSTSVSTQYGHIRSEISSPTQGATKGNMYIDALDTDGTLYTGIGISGKVAKLYYADSERLATTSAGLDVTGTVTSGELLSTVGLKVAGHPVVGYASFDSGYATRLGSTGSSTLNATQIYAGGVAQATFKGGNVAIGSTNNGVGGTIDLSVGNTSSTGGITLWSNTGGTHSLGFGDGYSGTDRYRGYVEYAHNGDSMRFATSATERLRINNSGELQIGGTTNAGFVDFDGTSLQLNTQRNPNTGAFVNTGRSHAGITLRGGDADSSIKFYTKDSNNAAGTLALTIDKSQNATFAGSVTTGGNLHIAPASNTPYITGGAVSTIFRNNANNASLITILNGGDVGLGVAPTTNYGKALQIHDTGTNGASLRLTDSNTGSDTGNGLELIQLNTHSYIVNREAGNMEFIVSGQTGMTINSSGRIGVDIAPQNNVNLTVGSPATLTNYYSFQATNASGNTRFLVDGVGSSFFYKTDNALGMKFDSSSGNVLVAKTTADSGTVGFEARATGEVMATAAGTATLYAKRNTNDGDVIVVQGPSGTVGSIGADGGSLVIGGGDVGIGFYQVANALVPYNGVTDLRDSAIDLGMASSGRFKDLHLSGTAFAYRMKAVTGSSGGSAHANADEIVAESNIDAGISILSGQSYKGSLFFGDSGLNSDGRIEYSQGNRSMTFATAGSDAVTIDSSANLGIGTADPQEQLHVYNGSTSAVIRVSGQGNINRKAEIGYNASAGPYVAAGSSGITSLKFYVDNTSLAGKFDTNGDFYSNDGTVHSLSDSRVKKDIADLTDGLAIVKQLKPRTFKFNGKATTLDDNRTRYGFIADEVMTVAPQYVSVDTQTIDGVEVDDFKSLSTTKMIPMLVKAIQEQQKVIESLTARITTLEG